MSRPRVYSAPKALDPYDPHTYAVGTEYPFCCDCHKPFGPHLAHYGDPVKPAELPSHLTYYRCKPCARERAN